MAKDRHAEACDALGIDRLDADAIRKAIAIEPLALQEEFVGLPADVSYWTNRYVAARRAAMLAEAVRKEAEAAGYLEECRPKDGAAKAPTVDAIKSAVTVRADVAAAVRAEIDAAAAADWLRGVVSALNAKRDALISIGAAVRVEMQGDPALRRDARTDARERQFDK